MCLILSNFVRSFSSFLPHLNRNPRHEQQWNSKILNREFSFRSFLLLPSVSDCSEKLPHVDFLFPSNLFCECWRCIFTFSIRAQRTARTQNIYVRIFILISGFINEILDHFHLNVISNLVRSLVFLDPEAYLVKCWCVGFVSVKQEPTPDSRLIGWSWLWEDDRGRLLLDWNEKLHSALQCAMETIGFRFSYKLIALFLSPL